jgi:uncharacterized membrane protein YjgN (DUF898 family)
MTDDTGEAGTSAVPEDAGTPPQPLPDTAGARRGESLVFASSATWGGIAPITLLNALLNIVTLTLWRFWGRTRVRRYLWSTTTINGIPLEYTGTGWELFRSFIFVMIAIFLPVYAVFFAGQLLLPPEHFMLVFGVAYIPFLLFFYWLLGIAMWVARRYRLSRTTWRSIRLGQAGSANGYAWAAIGYALLSIITLGWYSPAAEMRLTRRLWRETFYGDRQFTILREDEGLAGPLYPAFALAWFSGVVGYIAFVVVYMALIWADLASGEVPATPTLMMIVKMYAALFVFFAVVGLFSLPYAAALLRRKAEILGLEDLDFRLRAGFLSLGWVYVVNLLIIVFTLGFGLPIAQMRLWRYVFNRLEANGEIDIEAIRQNADRGPKSGEGLADAFDIGNVI